MSAISWAGLEAFSSPASTSTASSGDDWFRSFMSSVALGLQPSFAWPGSGGGSAASAGESAFGNARCAVAGNSAVTGGYGDGFLLLNQNHVSLHHIGSTWTGMLGHSAMLEWSKGSTSAPTKQQTGTFSLTSSTDSHFGLKTVAFPVPYTATIGLVVRLMPSNCTSYIICVSQSSITTGGFTSFYSGLTTAEADTVVTWMSDGG